MERKDLGLVGAGPLPTGSGSIRIQKGDILREGSSRKVWKVSNVYRKYDNGEYFVECEDMEPGAYGVVRIFPIGSLSLLT